ncbi:hypothetical protein [Hyunsoonleella ulvae]|uniref:hypothetical protein n=1 Tax=Hyunsoonleella ulvae TaxID=2799948 RepID=UPI00193AA15F|nr:hypothetical protein [Hyunsoonleella ulvae]
MPEPFTILGISAASLLTEIGKGILVNKSDHYFCKSVEGIYNKLSSRLEEPTNHDILKAVRRAQLNSSLMACMYVAKSKYNAWDELFSRAPKNLREVTRYLKNEIQKIDKSDYAFDKNKLIENPEFLIKPEAKTIQERIPELKDKQKQIIIDELKNANLYWVERSLKDAILNGWKDNEKTIDWYDLMSAFFSEELKSNSRLSKIIQTQYILDIKENISKLTNDYQSFDDKVDSLIDYYKELLPQVKEIFTILENTKVEIIQKLENVKSDLVNEIRLHENFPQIEVNQTYISLNQKIETLIERENYLKTEIEHRKSESKKELKNFEKERNTWFIRSSQKELINTNNERVEIEKRLNNFVIEVINLSNFLQSQNIITERGKEAEKLFYLGKFEEAINVLNDEDIYADIKRGKEGLKSYSKEFLFKAQAIEITQPDKCFEQAKQYYEDAIKTYEGFDTCLLYAHFLSKYHFNSQALKYYQKAFLDTSAETPENTYKIYRSFGECLMRLGEYDKAEYYLKSALKSKQENTKEKSLKKEIGELHINIGLSQREQKKYYQSIIEFGEALKIYQELEKNDSSLKYFEGKIYSELAVSVSNIAPQQLRIHPDEKSFSNLTEQEYLRARQAIDKLSNEDKINAARLLTEEYYQKSIEIFRDGLKNGKSDWSIGLFDVLYNYAHFQEDPKEAEPILTEALSIAEDLFNKNAAIYLKDLAETQRRMFHLKMALKDLKSAQDILLKACTSYYYLMEVDPKTFGELYAKTFMELGLFNLVHKKPSKETNELVRKYTMTALHFFESILGENIPNVQSFVNQCKEIIKEATIRDYKLEEKKNDDQKSI